MTSLTWQPLTTDSIPYLYQMFVSNAQHQGDPPPAMEQVRAVVGMLGENIGAQSTSVLADDGTLIAAAFFLLMPDDEGVAAMIDWRVHHAHASPDLEDAVLGWLWRAVEGRAKSEFPEATMWVLRKSIMQEDANARAILERNAFTASRYSAQMSRSLDARPPAPLLPDGVILRPYAESYDDSVRQAFNEAFSEHWGLGELDQEAWRERFTGKGVFRADLSYVLLHEDDVIAFCLSEDHSAEGTILMEAIGTRKAWRGQGLASAVMIHAMQGYADSGFSRAVLDVDTENITGALRLYEKLGFVVDRISTIYTRVGGV